MRPEKLYTNDGGFVTEVLTPPWATRPELLVWGERFFLLRRDGRYMEAQGAFFLPPEATVSDRDVKPENEPTPAGPKTPLRGTRRPLSATCSGEAPDPDCADRSVPTTKKRPDGQYEDHWALPEEELKKGFVRPFRRDYVHVGPPLLGELRDLTSEEKERYAEIGYAKFEVYPESESPKTGRFWTQAELDRRGGCGTRTIMPTKAAETYARQPDAYGSTFCCGCGDYYPVGAQGEFVWDGTDERVGT